MNFAKFKHAHCKNERQNAAQRYWSSAPRNLISLDALAKPHLGCVRGKKVGHKCFVNNSTRSRCWRTSQKEFVFLFYVRTSRNFAPWASTVQSSCRLKMTQSISDAKTNLLKQTSDWSANNSSRNCFPLRSVPLSSRGTRRYHLAMDAMAGSRQFKLALILVSE